MSFTDHDVSTVVAWGFDHTKRNGLDPNDKGRVFTDDLFDSGQSLIEYTQGIGLFEINATRTCSFLEPLEIQGAIVVMGEHANLDFSTLAVVVHDREFVRWRKCRDIDGVGLTGFSVVNPYCARQRLSSSG